MILQEEVIKTYFYIKVLKIDFNFHLIYIFEKLKEKKVR